MDELFVDALAGVELTSVNVDPASGIFTGDAAKHLVGSCDHDADDNIFDVAAQKKGAVQLRIGLEKLSNRG